MVKNQTIQDKLKVLFSRKVLIKRLGSKRLKVVDLSGAQSTNQNDYVFDRYRRLHTRHPGYGTARQDFYHNNRLNLYTDYEIMDNDPIISSALDILSDESTLKNPTGDVLRISTDNDRVREVLENLYYDIINIEHTCWPLIRNLCKYGDYFWYLDIHPKIGIRNVIPVSPHIIQRQEGYNVQNPHAYRFIIDDTSLMEFVSFLPDKILEAYQVAHFRLLSDTNYLPYGKSTIENTRKIFKQLSLMEDAMMLVRIMRAPERRVFKIDVGNLPPEDVESHIEDVKNTMQKTPYIDPQTGDYNLRYNLISMLEDFFIPVRGGNSGTAIETLPGLNSTTQIEDIEYLRKKLIASLKVPPAFLGYDSDLGGRATLASLDIRFARTIERLQRIVASELKKIGIIHLYVQGFTEEEIMTFDISLTTPSIVYERQKVEFMSEQIALVESMLNNKIFSYRHIYENVLGLTESEWRIIQDEMLTDASFNHRLAEIDSTGEDPLTRLPGDKTENPDSSEDSDNMEPTRIPEKPIDGREKISSKNKINAGYDEDGTKDLNNSVNPDQNPLGPDFYGKGPLNTGRNYKNKITETSRIIQYMDENNLKEY